MGQKDKQLLFKDLCARLPYGVMIEGLEHPEVMTIKHLAIISVMSAEPYKPYLRPMSSMTEKESAELSNIISEWYDKELFYLTEEPFLEYALSEINYSINPQLFDWLNAHHFDYRGLIEKGVAIEVTEENNPYKDK